MINPVRDVNMAAWVRNLHPVARAAVITVCGAAMTGFAYMAYRQFHIHFYGSRDDNRDEGFEDLPVVSTGSVSQ